MEYHQPDNTWTIWCDNYESYVKNFVIKGQFHANVPEGIINSYKVAEHIMAHAYYFYPMYDDVMVRLTGIFEMAVKKRCLELDISLKSANEQGVAKDKLLVQLIKDLNKTESGKQLHFQLNWARRIRNLLAHPRDYGFMGGNIRSSVQEAVNIINKMFLPEVLFIVFFKERKRMSRLLKAFSDGLWVLAFEDRRFLVTSLKVVTAIKIGNQWKYLIAIEPVYTDFEYALREHKYLKLFLLCVSDVKVQATSLTAIVTHTVSTISLHNSNKEKDKLVYEKHLTSWQQASKENQLIYTRSMDMDTHHKESDMYYELLYQLE